MVFSEGNRQEGINHRHTTYPPECPGTDPQGTDINGFCREEKEDWSGYCRKQQEDQHPADTRDRKNPEAQDQYECQRSLEGNH